MLREPLHAAEQPHRRDIEVRSFPVPLRENSVDMVHAAIVATKYLDVKIFVIILTSR
jgi:hypothetical protein